VTPPPARALGALLGAAAVLLGCGGDAYDAPESPLPAECKRVDDYLAPLVALVEADALPHLGAALGEGVPEDARRDLVSALLRIVAGFERGTFSALAPVVLGLEPTEGEGLTGSLGRVLRWLAADSPHAPYPAALGTLRGALATCEGAPVLALLRDAVDDVELTDALGAALAGGALGDALGDLRVEGEDGREAVRLLMRNLLVAATSRDFDVRTVTGLLSLVVDIGEPPWGDLVARLEALLAHDRGLPALQGLLVCLLDVDPDVALGPLLFDLLTADGLLGSAAGEEPDDGDAPSLDPAARHAASQALDLLAHDPLARRALATVGIELLRPEVAPGALLDLATLLEADALGGLVQLLAVLATGTCEAPP